MDSPIITKKCTACGESKRISPNPEFRKQSKNKDGFKYVCIECDDKKQKARYHKSREDYIEKVKEWQTANVSKVRTYQKKYYERNSDSNNKNPETGGQDKTP
jgi:hypothetical protein